MEQGILFEPRTVAQAELQLAIERLDFADAVRKLEEFQRLWPSAALTWETELIRIGSKWARRRLDLDSGYQAWEKLEARLVPLGASGRQIAAMRRNFFSRLVAANRRLFEPLRTPAGRSLGDFYLLAEQPNNARRRYENEICELGDRWELRLRLGNCDLRLGHPRVARSNYHWSFLAGLPEEAWSSIEELEFLARLRDAEDPEWAFPEVCATGEIPPARFSTRAEFERFKSGFGLPAGELSGPRRFCFCWVVSENKPFCSEGELLEARRQMKALNPELHSQYMRRLK